MSIDFDVRILVANDPANYFNNITMRVEKVLLASLDLSGKFPAISEARKVGESKLEI